MSSYHLLRPVYRAIDSVYYRLSFAVVRRIEAPTAEEALAEAKRLGYNDPVIEPAKDDEQ